MKKVLVTGASGFVGRFLCARLLADDWSVRGAIRSSKDPLNLNAGVETTVVETLGPDTNWISALEDIDTVIHLAARVHIMNDKAADPLTEFRRTNVAGSERLASEAVRAGVKRMVFISSIKVNGEENSDPYTAESPPNPADPYGISKWEAEQTLHRIETESKLEMVIVRPTLAYGPGVKANFLTMMKVVQSGIPLPLASVRNKRSLIYIGNLVDALALCATHPAAAGKTYLVSDNDDVSTPELIRRVAHALDKPPRLFPLSPYLMRLAGTITGKGAVVSRLLGSLVVDSSRIRDELGWRPPFTMDQGLRETAEWFRGQ